MTTSSTTPTTITTFNVYSKSCRVLRQLRHRVTAVEDLMPTKADKAELEAAIQEFKDEIAKLNIEESLFFGLGLAILIGGALK